MQQLKIKYSVNVSTRECLWKRMKGWTWKNFLMILYLSSKNLEHSLIVFPTIDTPKGEMLFCNKQMGSPQHVGKSVASFSVPFSTHFSNLSF